MNLRYISLFSGIECASVAAKPLGWEPVCFSEIEPFPSAVLAYHYPDVPNVGDMTAHDWRQYRGQCDLVVGGSPCQAFSVAGRRESLADTRGNLTLSFVEAVNAIDPAFVVWENVPGVLNTRDNAFGCFLAALAGHDSPFAAPGGKRWPDAGEVTGPRRALAWRVLDAQYFGVPQRRRRVFLVGCPRASGVDPAEILFEFGGMCRDSAPRRRTPQDFAGTLTNRAHGGGGLGTDFDCAEGLQPVAGALSRESFSGGTGGRPEGVAAGHFVPVVSSAVTSKWAKGTGGPSGDECQNLVSNPVSPSLTANPYGDHESREGLLVAHSTDVAGTITGSLAYGGPDDNDAARGMYVAHTLRGDGFDASEDGTGRGTPRVTAFHGSQDPDVSGAVTHPVGRNQGLETCVMASGVRRLTPRECERLQGLPDNYTRIPWRGKPAEECPDGPRYRAIGNGMAAPCVAWIFGRIKEARE